MGDRVTIRDARPDELVSFGELVIAVYSGLEGFPSRSEQPQYYELPANVDRLARKPDARALVAVSLDEGVHANDRCRRSLIPTSTVASGRLRGWTGHLIGNRDRPEGVGSSSSADRTADLRPSSGVDKRRGPLIDRSGE